MSVGGEGPNSRLFRPVDGISHEFRPVAPETKSESGHQSGPILVEMVILKDSPNRPQASFCDKDGNFHTGDLFEEVLPGLYVSRGRDDDWIKSENALRCDTRCALPVLREAI
jgi:acyl-coenzyme A synthetase/AMP-(fatty) acid ligase